MARGFESKDVEFQQAEAERARALRPALTPEQREAASERHTIELALTRAKADRERARSAAHRTMLDRAVEELESRLRRFDDAAT